MDIAFTTPSPGNLDIVMGALMTLAGIAILLTHKPTTLSRADKQILEAAKR